MRNLSFFLIIGLLVSICCSGGIEGPPPKPPTIPESYFALAIHYNNQSINGIKAFYSPSFKHNGVVRDDLDSLWSYRVGDGSTKVGEFDVVTDYGDTLAWSVLDVYFYKNDILDTLHIEAGWDYDDVCFWKKEGGYWKLYGNQIDSLEPSPICNDNF